MRFSLLVIVFFIIISGISFAHDHPTYFNDEGEFTEEQPSLVALTFYWFWGIHDRIHWIVIILMLYTCYHFRYVSGKRIFTHPKMCAYNDKGEYLGESKLHYYHRYFWYANVFLIGIHWSEAITGWIFGLQYTYKFTFQELGIFLEALYLITFTLWLLSCHFFRYFTGGDNPCLSCSRGGWRTKIFQKESKFNQYHGIFMWSAIISMILLLLVAGHL